MAMCERFMISSGSGQRLDARLWTPEGKPRAVVQLVHGMGEHIGRYDDLAAALNAAGIAAAGHTQLGHGSKAPIRGYLADRGGWRHLVEDVHRLRGVIQERYPDVPYFLLGQGMGGLVVRCCLAKHGEGLRGAVLLGQGVPSARTLTLGRIIAGINCCLGGRRKPSETLEQLAFGWCGKPFQPLRTDYDWLSRDSAQVDRFMGDEYCSLTMTSGGYRDVLRGIRYAEEVQTLQHTPKMLPLLFLSGDHDPLGGMGQAVETLAQRYRDAGCQQVEVRLYPDSRHDVLHESDRAKVFRDVIIFVDECCNRGLRG